MHIYQTIKHSTCTIKNTCNAFIESTRTYLFIFGKLLLDSLYRFKWNTVIIITGGVLGSFIFIGSMAQIIIYTKALGNDTLINVLGYSLQPRSAKIFVLFSISVLLFWVIGSLLIFYSNSRTLKFIIKYETFCAKRICLILACMNGLITPGNYTSYGNQYTSKLLSRDPRFLGRTIRLLIKLLQPGCILLLAMASLFYINFSLSVLIVITLSISLFFHYKNNRRGALHHRAMEDTGVNRSMFIKEIKTFAIRKKTCSSNFKLMLDDSFRTGALHSNQQHYRGRFQVLENALLINNLTLIILLTLVLIVLGRNAFASGEGWGGLIVYIIALRYCSNQIKVISATMTGINRFYPVFLRYFNFIELFKTPKMPSELNPTRKYIINADETLSEKITLNLDETNLMALAVPCSFKTHHLPTYMGCLFNGKSGLVKIALKSSRVITKCEGFLNGLSIRELFNLPSELTLQELNSNMAKMGIDSNAIKWIKDIDTPCTDEIWKQISSEAKYVLAFSSALFSGAEWIIIEQKVLHDISDEIRNNVFELYDRRNIVIIYSDIYDEIGQYGETNIAVTDGEKLIGTGSINWFTKNKEQLSGKLADSKSKAMKTFAATDESSEDDDLEFEME